MTISKLFEKKYPQDGTIPEWARTLAIEFARHHVKEALKEAYENVRIDSYAELNGDIIQYVEKDSIINAYPLSNIK